MTFTSARLWVACALAMAACGRGSLDAGADDHSLLPVDSRNPVVLFNDGGFDNWQGELALLLASKGTLALEGIVVNTSPNYPKIEENIAGWRRMTAAAREVLQHVPDPIDSGAAALVRPSDGNIDSTALPPANRSNGALFIVDASKKLSRPWRPLVVLTGGKLTDVAAAYLIDRTVAERIVVLSSVGTATKDGAQMGRPNGEMDTWADIIVAQRLRYIQVSVLYDQTLDVPALFAAQLPPNPFTRWVQDKQPQILNDPRASDQVAVAVLGLPSFVSSVSTVVQQGSDSSNLPLLSFDSGGPDWLVYQVDGPILTLRLLEMLTDKRTYGSY